MGKLIERLVLLVSFVMLLVLSGQVPLHLPGVEIPITWQSMLVILLPLVYERWVGTTAVLVYVASGILGLPVFSGWNGGIGLLTGNHGGYLIGFAVCALLAALMKKRLTKEHYLRPLGLFLLLHACLMVCGLLWIQFVGSGNVSWSGNISPFLFGIIVKSFLGAGMFVVITVEIKKWLRD